MAILLRNTLIIIKDYLQRSGLFDSVDIGEPNAPIAGWHASLLLTRVEIPEVTLTGTIERRTVLLRIYTEAYRDPRSDIEFGMDERQAKIIEALLGDFDLGSTVRDLEPTLITVNYGYIEIGGKMHRVGEIALVMTIDDSATFVA